MDEIRLYMLIGKQKGCPIYFNFKLKIVGLEEPDGIDPNIEPIPDDKITI